MFIAQWLCAKVVWVFCPSISESICLGFSFSKTLIWFSVLIMLFQKQLQHLCNMFHPILQMSIPSFVISTVLLWVVSSSLNIFISTCPELLFHLSYNKSFFPGTVRYKILHEAKTLRIIYSTIKCYILFSGLGEQLDTNIFSLVCCCFAVRVKMHHGTILFKKLQHLYHFTVSVISMWQMWFTETENKNTVICM